MLNENFRVGVVGAGYVGLVTAACLAHIEHRVTCLDSDEERVTWLRQDRVPFYEPGLAELVSRGVREERLSFSGPESLPHLVRAADMIFVAVDTPQAEDGSADLSSLASVARSIGHALVEAYPREHPLVVVNKSTVPVGSGDYVSMLIREGLEEAGADSREGLDALRVLYEPIIEQSFPTELDPRPKVAVPFVTTDLASAEMIKYAANAFLATKISFINEVANLCELTGADVLEVGYGIGLD